MFRYFLTFIGVLFFQDILFAQIFEEQVLDADSLPIRKIESESFQLDDHGNAHILIYNVNDSLNNLYYINNANEGKSFSKPLLVKSEKFASNEGVFFHFLSIDVGNSSDVYIFYVREEAKHDEDFNLLSKSNQIKCLKTDLSGTVQEEILIYETGAPVLNSRCILDKNENIHVSFLLQSDSFDPESPKIINYINNVSGNFDQVINVSGGIIDANLHHFQFLLDREIMPHFFITNYDGARIKYYLKYWYENVNSFQLLNIDSVSDVGKTPWFESVNATSDDSGEIQLLYLVDSIYQAGIFSQNEINRQSIVPRILHVPYSVADFECADSVTFSSISLEDESSMNFIWNFKNLDSVYSFKSEFVPIGFEFDKEGFIHGVGLSSQDSLNYHKLIYIKSAIPFDPLPKLPPDPPAISDKVFCVEDEKTIVFNGVGITWYKDNLNSAIGYRDTLEIKDLQPGLNRFLATETIFSSTSEPDTFLVNLSIPQVDLGNDTTIAFLDSILIELGDQFVNYTWNIGSDSSSALIVGTEFGPGVFDISVLVENEYGCYAKDTILIAVSLPISPTIEDKNFCSGDEKIIIFDGERITWYKDNLINEIGSGDTIDISSLEEPGFHLFLATETIFNYTSQPDTFYVNINLPEVDLGSDTLITYLDSLIIYAGENFVNYEWNLGSDSSSVLVIGAHHDLGELSVSVIVENEFGCLSEDTVLVKIESPLGLKSNWNTDFIIYPNPSNNFVIIDLSPLNLTDNAEIFLFNSDGSNVMQSPAPKSIFSLDLKLYKSNLLILKITDQGKVITRKLIVN